MDIHENYNRLPQPPSIEKVSLSHGAATVLKYPTMNETDVRNFFLLANFDLMGIVSFPYLDQEKDQQLYFMLFRSREINVDLFSTPADSEANLRAGRPTEYPGTLNITEYGELLQQRNLVQQTGLNTYQPYNPDKQAMRVGKVLPYQQKDSTVFFGSADNSPFRSYFRAGYLGMDDPVKASVAYQNNEIVISSFSKQPVYVTGIFEFKQQYMSIA